MSYITHDSCMLAISTALFHLERDPGHDTSYVTQLASRPFVPQVWCIRFLKYVSYAFDNNYEPYVLSYVLHHRIIYPYITYLCGNVTYAPLKEIGVPIFISVIVQHYHHKYLHLYSVSVTLYVKSSHVLRGIQCRPSSAVHRLRSLPVPSIFPCHQSHSSPARARLSSCNINADSRGPRVP